MHSIIIDCISDTHEKQERIKLPGGDILLHSGDCSFQGKYEEVVKFLDWFSDQDYSHLIFVPGNHDFIFERDPELMKEECEKRGIILLNDSGVTVEGLKIWGSPITPWFHDWAFNRERGDEITKHWNLIPEDTDILITHGPPHMIRDGVPRRGGSYEHVGCWDLYQKILKTKVKLHVFGHIHEGRGHSYVDGRTFVNASSLDGMYCFDGKPYTRVIKDENSFVVEIAA